MKTLLPILAALALFIALPAQAAEFYIKGGGIIANVSDLDSDNLGFAGEMGLQGDYLAGGLEISNHRHLGDSVLGIAGNGYLYPFSLGPVDPYLMIGVGASDRGTAKCRSAPQDQAAVRLVKDDLICLRDEHQPFSQAAIGAEWNITGSFALYGEGRIRWYHREWGDVLQFSDYGDAGEDTMILAGGKFKF